jgi:hypothetical protein
MIIIRKDFILNLDYSLKTPEERVECVNQVIAELGEDNVSPQYKKYMADYMLFTQDKNQTKKEHKEEHSIITRNREVTVSKRQVSFEEVVSNLENGEDGIYALITNDKNQILDHKTPLTQEDVRKMPELQSYLDVIESLKKQFAKAQGYDRYLLKRQIIEAWQQLYIVKASLMGAPAKGRTPNQVRQMVHTTLDEYIWIDENQMPQSDCMLTLFNPNHVSFLLCYYSRLKQECEEDLNSDMHYLLMDLEQLATEAIEEQYPVLWQLLIWKVDGRTNEEIQDMMQRQFGVVHNEQYFSTLWRRRIPKLISDAAKKQYLLWYFTNRQYGHWKTCGKCGETKLAHPLFFSKNNSSSDGLYSICKQCRSKNKKKE